MLWHWVPYLLLVAYCSCYSTVSFHLISWLCSSRRRLMRIILNLLKVLRLTGIRNATIKIKGTWSSICLFDSSTSSRPFFLSKHKGWVREHGINKSSCPWSNWGSHIENQQKRLGPGGLHWPAGGWHDILPKWNELSWWWFGPWHLCTVFAKGDSSWTSRSLQSSPSQILGSG